MLVFTAAGTPEVHPKARVSARLYDVAPGAFGSGVPALCIGEPDGAGIIEQFYAPEIDGKGLQPQVVSRRPHGCAAHSDRISAKGEFRIEREGSWPTVHGLGLATRDQNEENENSRGKSGALAMKRIHVVKFLHMERRLGGRGCNSFTERRVRGLGGADGRAKLST